MKTKSAQKNCTLQNPIITQQLYLAFELGQKEWKLGFTIGVAQRPRIRTINGRDLGALAWEIQQARRRFGLPETAPVVSCYEAGRDGFWLHRHMLKQEVANLVVDSSSIEVNRRARRAKTDKLDAGKLLGMLIRYHNGDEKVWRVVNVPSVEAEDRRHLHRELVTLKKDRTRHINRIKGYLACLGICMQLNADFLEKLERVRMWDGSKIPKGVRTRMEREHQRLQMTRQQIKDLEAQRRKLLRTSDHPSVEQVRHLMRLKSIGVNIAWLVVMEYFSWREFRNRKEVGALTGLTGTPYVSGGSSREQGISKAGNRYVRGMIIEIAWLWLYHQPDSELTRWYQRRFGSGSSRVRRIGIVALARKLLIELWRYLETGTLPEGAVLKS